ncbi:hypothetical protein B4077_6139 [Bacillus cereus]|uniref:Uncharacterized protein n=1 Tax=Bacillus cereus TaxID=1396 RepID=A0A0G8EJ92_BACCE|nr:hypothetical protein B4077_6139 [Bacillus cereus]
MLNLKGERNRPETSWMFSPTKGRYWGMKEFEEIMNPIKQYDGIYGWTILNHRK